jgi:hypothetical protein
MEKKKDNKKATSLIVIRPKDESTMKTLRKSMMAQKACCRGSIA